MCRHEDASRRCYRVVGRELMPGELRSCCIGNNHKTSYRRLQPAGGDDVPSRRHPGWRPANSNELGGVIGRPVDMPGDGTLPPTGDFIDRCPLEYFKWPHSRSRRYVVVETRRADEMLGATNVPRSYPNGDAPVVQDLPPYNGNGYTSSRDGHLTPEWKSDGRKAMQREYADDGAPATVTKLRTTEG